MNTSHGTIALELFDEDAPKTVDNFRKLAGDGFYDGIIFHRVIAPRLMGLAPDEAAIEAAMPKARTVFTELARLLGDQPFFAGNDLSLADMLVAPGMSFFAATPEWAELGAPHANLVAWLTRMESRPSMKATTWERVSELAKAA